jgi:hypothetical protein
MIQVRLVSEYGHVIGPEDVGPVWGASRLGWAVVCGRLPLRTVLFDCLPASEVVSRIDRWDA